MIIILLFIIIILLLALFYYKTKSDDAEEKASSKDSVVRDLEITKKDEKIISKIFNRKISKNIFGNKKKKYTFSYSKNDYSFGGCNSEFDVIETEITKLSINNELFFNVEFYAWGKLVDYKTKQSADVEITNIVTNPENLKIQVEDAVKKLFTTLDSELAKEIKIENT